MTSVDCSSRKPMVVPIAGTNDEPDRSNSVRLSDSAPVGPVFDKSEGTFTHTQSAISNFGSAESDGRGLISTTPYGANKEDQAP
ncbi:MAG: hypothetical protein GY869_30150, partial [Planctomycetes bacterium]|nr:hypothetical protein [Planctomycetota bacterium]